MNVFRNIVFHVPCRRQILERISNRDVKGSQKIFNAVRQARKDLMLNYKSAHQRNKLVKDEHKKNLSSGDWEPKIGDRVFVPSINAHATVIQISKDTVSLHAGLFQMQARIDQVLQPQL